MSDVSVSLIRDMNPMDLRDVVLVHHQAFPDFFMTLLGSSFLRRYYLTVLEYEKSVSLVCVDVSGNVIGFAVGFAEPDKFYKFFRGKIIQFFLPTLKGFIRNPFLIRRIMAGFSRVSRAKLRSSSKGLCELSSIGVAKKGSGAGKLLLKRFIELCFLKGAKEIMLTTNLNNNDGVIAFYKSEGFIETGTHVRGDREVIEFLLKNTKNNDN